MGGLAKVTVILPTPLTDTIGLTDLAHTAGPFRVYSQISSLVAKVNVNDLPGTVSEFRYSSEAANVRYSGGQHINELTADVSASDGLAFDPRIKDAHLTLHSLPTYLNVNWAPKPEDKDKLVKSFDLDTFRDGQPHEIGLIEISLGSDGERRSDETLPDGVDGLDITDRPPLTPPCIPTGEGICDPPDDPTPSPDRLTIHARITALQRFVMTKTAPNCAVPDQCFSNTKLQLKTAQPASGGRTFKVDLFKAKNDFQNNDVFLRTTVDQLANDVDLTLGDHFGFTTIAYAAPAATPGLDLSTNLGGFLNLRLTPLPAQLRFCVDPGGNECSPNNVRGHAGTLSLSARLSERATLNLKHCIYGAGGACTEANLSLRYVEAALQFDNDRQGHIFLNTTHPEFADDRVMHGTLNIFDSFEDKQILWSVFGNGWMDGFWAENRYRRWSNGFITESGGTIHCAPPTSFILKDVMETPIDIDITGYICDDPGTGGGGGGDDGGGPIKVN